MFDWSIIVNIGKGLLVGFGTSLFGYIKNIPDGETFQWFKATPALIIGAIVGVIATLSSLPYDTALAIAGSYGVITIINSLWSAITKHRAKAVVAKK